MAKTGTSLIGRADTTLVQGAYKTALSNVGLDMSKIYEQEVKDIKAFGEAFNDIVYATNKSNNDLFAEIKEGSAEMLANIDAGTYTDDEFIQIYSDAVQDLRNQMKAIPRGKEGEAERAKVRAQLARMKVSAENAEDVLTELATFAKEDQLDQFATSDVDVKLFRDIINKTAKRSIVNGELVYTNDVGDTITHNKLKERIIKKDHKTTGELLNVFNNISKYAQKEGAVFNDAYIRKTAQEISSKFTTRAGFLHVINNPIAGMEFSFVQAIGNDEELRAELVTALKQSGVDISDKASAAAVISELRNPSNQNLALVKGIASQYLAEKGGLIAFNLGSKLRKNNDVDGNPFGNPNKSSYNARFDVWINNGDRQQRRTFVESNMDFDGVGGSYNYDDKTKKWTRTSGDETEEISVYDILKEESLLLPGDAQAGLNESKSKKADELTDFSTSTFQQNDNDFVTDVENTYKGFSGNNPEYMIDVNRGAIFGTDAIGNYIIIRKRDKNGNYNRVFETRTNYSRKENALSALNRFLEFIKDEKIKKKIKTTSSGLPVEEVQG